LTYGESRIERSQNEKSSESGKYWNCCENEKENEKESQNCCYCNC
jgi:hypothetical protein